MVCVLNCKINELATKRNCWLLSLNRVWSDTIIGFSKAQISFAPRVHATLILFEKPSCENCFQIEREKSYDYL